MTNESISAAAESIRFKSRGSTDGGESFPGADPTSTMDVDCGAQGELGTKDENVVEGVPIVTEYTGP